MGEANNGPTSNESLNEVLRAVRELRGMGAVSCTVGAVSATFAPLQQAVTGELEVVETPEQKKIREERELFYSGG